MQATRDDGLPAAADFVKKLYKILEEKTFHDAVCWSSAGDCFVVRDVNEFTKLVLPHMFKHSNFASFVRQLNKYDFHKVKNGDDNQFGEQSWMFRHRDFRAGRCEALENIKRKASARKQASQVQTPVSSSSDVASTSHNPHSSTSPLSSSPFTSTPFSQAQTSFAVTAVQSASHGSVTPLPQNHSQVDHIQGQLHVLHDRNDEMLVRLRSLEQSYKEVLVEMVGLQRTVATQDSLLRNLIHGVASGGNPTAFMNQGGISHPSSQFDMKSNLSSLSSLATAAASVSALQLQTQPQPSSAPPRSLASLLSASTGMSGSSTSPPLLMYPSQQQQQHHAPPSVLHQNPSSPDLGLPPNMHHRLQPPRQTHAQTPSQPTPLHVPNPIQNDSQYLQSRFNKKRRYEYEREWYQTQHKVDEWEQRKKQRVDGEMSSNNGWVFDAGSNPPPQLRQQHVPQRMDLDGPSRGVDEAASRNGARMGGMDEGQSEEEEEEVVRPSPPRLGGFSIPSILSLIHSNESSVDSSAGGPASSSISVADPRRISNTTFSLVATPSPSAIPSLTTSLRGTHILDEEMIHLNTPETQTQQQQQNLPFNSDKPAFTATHVHITRQRRTPNSKTPASSSSTSSTSEASSSTTKTTTPLLSLPVWTNPPRVLLVDDDAVSRNLSSKFLKLLGCTIDVAVDGVSAVDKMEGSCGEEGEPGYDLVLMDIVMPKLDGVSATSLIRKFDDHTPIISMTSNSKPAEAMTYYSSGMNYILPKPFTKDRLLVVLEHLIHLMTMQAMNNIPRSIGIPPLSDASLRYALTAQVAGFLRAGSPPTPRALASFSSNPNTSLLSLLAYAMNPSRVGEMGIAGEDSSTDLAPPALDTTSNGNGSTGTWNSNGGPKSSVVGSSGSFNSFGSGTTNSNIINPSTINNIIGSTIFTLNPASIPAVMVPTHSLERV
ncbi:hypothetical protein BDN72DRAFT_94127 [Pluteus cervinus]|uniref:Uncharacterized protein n=1 Tax=Pluteus cervinus TaxID=181527 RepID=A0ACD3AQH8_9AGAR|nr:hypothetical protein BDN72DRAFT_94127 [Pluteus cervinus]